MLSLLAEHKGKLAIGLTLLVAGGYLYRHRDSLGALGTQSNVLSSLMNDKTTTEEQQRKDKTYRLLVQRVQQKITKNVVFVSSQVERLAQLPILQRALESTHELSTPAELIHVLVFAFSSLLLSRFFHLLQIVYTSIHLKQTMPVPVPVPAPAPAPAPALTSESAPASVPSPYIQATPAPASMPVLAEAQKPRGVLQTAGQQAEEEKKEEMKDRGLGLGLGLETGRGKERGRGREVQGMGGMESGAKVDEAYVFLQHVCSYMQSIVDDVRIHFEATLSALNTGLNNTECSQLLPNVYAQTKAKFCELQCGSGADPLDLSSYAILAVSKFVGILKRQPAGHAMYGEIEAFVGSVYFQSLLLQGLDLDFHVLNGEYQKMVALIFQGKAEEERVNIKDVVVGVLKAVEEARKKSDARYRSESELTSMNNYLEKLFKLLSSEQGQGSDDSKADTYKQSLKEFVVLMLFEQDDKSVMAGELPPLPNFDLF